MHINSIQYITSLYIHIIFKSNKTKNSKKTKIISHHTKLCTESTNLSIFRNYAYYNIRVIRNEKSLELTFLNDINLPISIL